MTITKNRLLKRGLAVLLVLVMCLGIMPMSTFAAETEETNVNETNSLAPGVYIAPLYQCKTAYGLDSPLDNEYQHFNGRAKLEVTEDGKQIVTIGVENWDFYEAFVPMDQEYNHLFGDEFSKNSETSWYTLFRNAFPEKLLKQLSEAGNEEAKAFMETSEYCTSKVNDFFKYGDIKYGDITVDTDTNHSSDTAYVSFEINDYREEIYVAAWANRPGGDGYEASRQFILNYADMYKAEQLEQAIESNNVGFRMMLPASMSKTATYNPVMYEANNDTSKIFDSVSTEIITDEDGNKKVKATYHVSDSYSKAANFSKLCGVEETEETDRMAWSLYSRAIMEPLTLSEDRYLTIEYKYNSIDDLIFGEYIYFENLQNAFTKRYVYYGQPVLAPKTEIYELVDENTGVKVSFKTSQVQTPENISLNVVEKPIDDTTESIVEYGYLKETSNWYKIELIDKSTGKCANFVGGINVDIPLPENLTSENRDNYITKLLTAYGELESTPDFDYTSKYWYDKNEIYADGTLYYFVMNLANNATEQVKNLSDGIYSAEAFLFKNSSNPVPIYSMANGALIHKVYIVVENGEKKMYFKAQDIGGKGHLGEILCNDADKGSAYYDSITYTKYDTFEDGSLISNAGYDPITEWACVEGGILTLMDGSYYANTAEDAYYHVAIVAPPMAAMGGLSYDEVEIDDLGAKLQFSNVQLLADVTEEDVIAMFPYDVSALRREIDLCKTYDEYLYTTESWNTMQEVLEYASTICEGTNVPSATVEEQINLVVAARKALVVDESALGDKTELQTLVDTAKTYKEEDYTNASYNALQSAISVAEKALAREVITQTKLDEQVAALQAAMDALEARPETTLDKDNLADGKYTLSAEMFKTDRSSYSMANNAINHTVWLDVVDGEYYLTIQFKGLAIYNQFGYLSKLSYYNAGYTYSDYGIPQGDTTAAEVLSTQKDSDGNDVIDIYNDADNLYPELLKIKLVDKASEQYVPLHVFVPIMEGIAEGTGDQDVLMELDWSTIVKNESGEIDKEEVEEQSPAVDVTDKDTNVKVHADKGVFEEGVSFVVEPITSGADYDKAANALSDIGKKFKLFELHFENADGVEVQPNGTVTVSLPIPAGYDADELFVYRINADGTKTRVNGTVADGYFTVVTRNAGNYALVEAGSTITDAENTEQNGNTNVPDTNSPQTGDNSNMALWFTLMLASDAALVVLGFGKKFRFVKEK